MPLLPDINTGAISGQPAEDQLKNVQAQLNEWARLLSNEKTTNVQRGTDGEVKIVQGIITIGTTTLVGTLYYDNDGVDRIFIGLAPDDGRPGIWISKEGESVITLLGG